MHFKESKKDLVFATSKVHIALTMDKWINLEEDPGKQKPRPIWLHLMFVVLHDLPLLCRIPSWKTVVFLDNAKGPSRRMSEKVPEAHVLHTKSRFSPNRSLTKMPCGYDKGWGRCNGGPRESRDSWDLTRLGRPEFPLENGVLGLLSQVKKECVHRT